MEIVGKPVARVTLREQASQALRELVVQGALAPGSRINEVQLAAELGISRGPLREAIQGLAREGLLEVIQHRGAFVRSVDERSLRELYGLRIALETYAARTLGFAQDREPVAMLVRLVSEAEASVAADGGYPNDQDFHRGLMHGANNEALKLAAEDVQQRISVAWARSARNPDRARAALAEHRLVVDALAVGDGDRAAQVLEQHLWSSFENAIASLRLSR